MAKKDSERQPLPPYVPFKTFIGFMEKLKETTVPDRIDLSVLRNYSGGIARQLIATLKYLKLIEDNGQTSDALRSLVNDHGTPTWQETLQNLVVADGYAAVLGDLNIAVATRAQLEEKFKAVGAENQVLQKCIAFYIAAAIHANAKLSPHIVATSRGRSDRGRSRGRRARQEATKPDAALTDIPTPQAGTVRFSLPLPNKPPITISVAEDLTAEDWVMVDTAIRAYIERRKKS